MLKLSEYLNLVGSICLYIIILERYSKDYFRVDFGVGLFGKTET